MRPCPARWTEFVRFRRVRRKHGRGAGDEQHALSGGGQLVISADRFVIDQMHVKILRLFAIAYGARCSFSAPLP